MRATPRQALGESAGHESSRSRTLRTVPLLLVLLSGASFVVLGGAGCEWINGSQCSGGCIDADGVCRQQSHMTCGTGGEECADCTLDGMVCNVALGECRPNSGGYSGGSSDQNLQTERCCLVEDGGCEPLGKMCNYTEICQMGRGGPACKEVEEVKRRPEIKTCQTSCTNGCCTREGTCLEEPALIGCPVDYCDEENQYNRKCEDPLTRCKRDCADGCCTRDGKCERGQDDEACGTDGEVCDNCTYRLLACDEQRQQCAPHTSSGGLRICLESLVLKTPTEDDRMKVDGCQADRDRGHWIDVEAELYTSDGYAAGRERNATGGGSLRSPETRVGFAGNECFSIDGRTPADHLVMEFSEKDEMAPDIVGMDYTCPARFDPICRGQGKTGADLQQCIDDNCRLGGGSVNDDGCDLREKLGRCMLDLTGVAMGNTGGQPSQAITVRDCQPATSGGVEIQHAVVEVRLRRATSY
jgi:hypothetical protein